MRKLHSTTLRSPFSTIVPLVALLLLCLALPAKPDTLSLQGYVGLALRHNPSTRSASGSVEASAAARKSALAPMLPHVSAGADANRAFQTSSLSPLSSNLPDNSVSAGINAGLLLFDFGKSPLQYSAAGKVLLAAKSDSIGTIQSIIANAQSAYFNHLLAVRLLGVADSALRQMQFHLDQANALFEVGRQAKVAVIKAQSDVANAQVNVIHAENAVKLAKVQLESAAGVALSDPLALSDSLDMPQDSIGLSEALATAMKQRTDVRSAELRTQAAQMELRAAKASYLPSLNASGQYSWDASSVTGLSSTDNGHGWNVGANLSIPLYEGGATRAAVMQAEASYRQVEAGRDQVVLNAKQDVQQQYYNENEARQRIAATKVLIDESAENLRMVQERFRNGLTTAVDVSDAEVTLSNAQGSLSQALYDYRAAHVKLLSATGALHE